MNDTNNNLSGNEPSQRSSCVLGMLLWMAATLILASLSVKYEEVGIPTDYQFTWRLLLIVNSLIAGAAIAGMALLVSQQARKRINTEVMLPGHWILFILSIGPLGAIFLNPYQLSPAMITGKIFVLLLQVLCCLYAMFSPVTTVTWRYFFCYQIILLPVLGILELTGIPDALQGFLVSLIPDILAFLPALILAKAAYEDFFNRCNDLLHWSGIVIYIVAVVWNLFWNTVGWRFVG